MKQAHGGILDRKPKEAASNRNGCGWNTLT